MICRAVNGLSPSQGLQTGSPPLSGLRPTPLVFPLRGCRVRHCSPKTSGVGRSMVPAKPHPAPGGNEPWAPSAPTTGGNGFPHHPSLTGGERAPSHPSATRGRSTAAHSQRAAPTSAPKEATKHLTVAFSSRQPIHRTPFIPIASKQPPNPRTRMRPGRAKRAQDAFFPLTGILFHFKRENVSQPHFCAVP